MAGLIITKVIKTVEELSIGKGAFGPTIGNIIDKRIEDALVNGEQLSTVQVEIPQDDWDTMCDNTSANTSYSDTKPKFGR